MNALLRLSIVSALSITAACGGDFERGRDGADDTAADIDTAPGTSCEEVAEANGYAFGDEWELCIASWLNTTPYYVGLFGDQYGTDDGWQYAVGVGEEDEDYEAYSFNVRVFGQGTAFRASFGAIDEDLALRSWLMLDELPASPYLVEFKECDENGDIVTKVNLCYGMDEDGQAFPGDCSLTHVPPEDCEAHDGGGDSGSEDGDDGGDTGDGGTDGTDTGGDLIREVCVTDVTGAYDLGYLLMDTGDTSKWVTDNGTRAVVSSPLLTEGDSNGCATITLTSGGEQVKFNGWADESTYWHEYFVGSGTSGFCSGSTCAVGKVYVDSTVDGLISSDAEQAIISGNDLVWTD